MEILFPLVVIVFFAVGVLTVNKPKYESAPIVKYDIECEAGEFPLPTHLISPSVEVLKKCGYKAMDAKRAVNAVVVERPTIDSVGDVVRAAVLMLQVGGI